MSVNAEEVRATMVECFDKEVEIIRNLKALPENENVIAAEILDSLDAIDVIHTLDKKYRVTLPEKDWIRSFSEGNYHDDHGHELFSFLAIAAEINRQQALVA